MRIHRLLLLLLFVPFQASSQDLLHIWTQYTAADEQFPEGYLGNLNASVRVAKLADDNTFWLGTYRSGLIHFSPKDAGNSLVFDRQNTNLRGWEVHHVEIVTLKNIWFTNWEQFGSQFAGLHQLILDNSGGFEILPIDTIYGIDSVLTAFPAPVTCITRVATPMGDEIWIGTEMGIVSGLPQQTLYQHPDFSKEILAIVQSSDSTLFVLETGNQLTIRSNNSKKVGLKTYEEQLGNFTVKKVVNGPADTLWFLTSEGIIKQHYADTTLTFDTVITRNQLRSSPNVPRDVAFDSIGNPWMIFKNNGGIVYSDYRSGKKNLIGSLNSQPLLPDEASVILSNRSGQIWLGTDNDGLFVHRTTIPTQVSTPINQPLQVYPNPASYRLVIDLPGHFSAASTICLYDMNGRKYSLPTTSHELVLPPLAHGVYRLVVSTSNHGVYQTQVLINQ